MPLQFLPLSSKTLEFVQRLNKVAYTGRAKPTEGGGWDRKGAEMLLRFRM